MASSHGQITATGHEGHEHHVLPMYIYYGVYSALLVLTVLTVVVSFLDLGALSLPTAMLVAVIKAACVVGFFMHLRYDNRFLSLIFAVSILFLAIFFSFTLFDLTARGEFSQEEKTFTARDDGTAVYRVSQIKLVGHHHFAASATEALEVRRLAAEKAAKAALANKGGKAAPAPRPVVEAYEPPSPAALAKGKALFGTQCASCHGKEGRGDGLAAAGFPKGQKPRNFYTQKFKNGASLVALFKTITKGFPPFMASFAGLPSDQRLLLAKYVRNIYMVNQVLPKQKAAQKAAARQAPPTRREAKTPTRAPAPAPPTR